MTDSCQSSTGKIDDLSPARRALLELRLKQKGRFRDEDPIVRRDAGMPAPLSFAQELLWLQDQLTPGPAYNVPRALKLHGDLDVDALTATLRDIVDRQEILRTRFISVGGTPVQIVDEDRSPPLEIVDLREIPQENREDEAVRVIRDRAVRSFNLSSDSLLWTSLLRLGPQDYILLLMTHHIASDGWSRDVLFREITELYDAHRNRRSPNLPALTIQYADFSAWQRAAMEGPSLKSQLAYWKQQLADAPPVLDLPVDFPRPAIQTSEGARLRRHLLNSDELTALKAVGRQESATLFITALTCAFVFLFRHTGQRDIVVGTPIAGRSRKEIEHLLGYFTNTLVLRNGVTGDMTFRDVLRQVRRTSLGAFENQDLPYAKLVAELNPERTLSYNPVFQVLFGFGQVPPPPFAVSDLACTPFLVDRGIAKFDLTVSTSEVDDGLVGMLEYKTGLFTPETMDSMMDRLQILLKSVPANIDAKIAEIPFLSEAETARLLVEWNETDVEYPKALNVSELFEAQVERTPNRAAVEFLGKTLTYSDLNDQVNRVAHFLRGCGVGPEVTVGVLVERSPELIITLLGILKAGGAYVPLDENYPRERALSVLKTAGAPVVVTQRALEGNLSGYDGRIVCLDRDKALIAQESEENPKHNVTPENLAYVMFTSGSTGEPKGIAVQQSSLLHYIRAATDTYALLPSDRILQFASICFDTSIEEILPCLTIGATLVVRSQDMLDSVPTFWTCTGEWGITVLSLPTAFWHELSSSFPIQDSPIPESLRLVVIGGEKARPDRLEAWRKQAGVRVQLLNTYGPTESTVVATAFDITNLGPGEIPIGRPIPNVRVYLMDDSGRTAPRGVVGEIYIGGAGLARGYVNDPSRTAERFVPDPYTPGARLYRTGDLGRYRSDGSIEFMGRPDDQIKIRGFRIELGEIESVLALHPAVGDVAVLAPLVDGEERRIVAYVAPAGALNPTSEEFRVYLQGHLPAYMVPSKILVLSDLPKTPGGKVDKRALPAADWSEMDVTGEFVPPGSPVEETLAGIWQEVLGLSRVSVNSSFFDLGGHSLLATRVISRIRALFQVDLPLRALFESPTVAELAVVITHEMMVAGDEDLTWLLDELEAG